MSPTRGILSFVCSRTAGCTHWNRSGPGHPERWHSSARAHSRSAGAAAASTWPSRTPMPCSCCGRQTACRWRPWPVPATGGASRRCCDGRLWPPWRCLRSASQRRGGTAAGSPRGAPSCSRGKGGWLRGHRGSGFTTKSSSGCGHIHALLPMSSHEPRVRRSANPLPSAMGHRALPWPRPALRVRTGYIHGEDTFTDASYHQVVWVGGRTRAAAYGAPDVTPPCCRDRFEFTHSASMVLSSAAAPPPPSWAPSSLRKRRTCARSRSTSFSSVVT
mmetsp:Transcript_36121/g.108473  ORF Transcript_36121/g.108473 Transcript_36121/m.108473 type:complete len:274 (-) Transcript_36121:1902-2723(-)